MAITGELSSAAEGSEEDLSLSDVATDVTGVDTDGDIAPDKAANPSELDDTKLFEVLRGWFRADAMHSANWRTKAEEWYRFRAGDQWSEEDKQLLNAQQRPHIVFNRVLTVVKAVAGMEINGRHEITFLPRNTTETKINELLSAASKWMADGCDAEDEESSAFEDVATCGLGWCENRLDYTEVWNGKYVEEQVDPLEMFWDRTAAKKNLSDARRMFRRRKMPIADAKQLFPGFNRSQLDAGWSSLGNEGTEPTKTVEEKRWRTEENSEVDYDDNNEVVIVHCQWWELQYYWKVANLQNNTTTELSEDQYKTLQQRMQLLGADNMVKAVRLPKRVYKQAFIGNCLLKKEDSPVKNQFTWKCITGELDKMKGTWFGLVQVMQDPQRWSNKWLSQVLHILNTTAKGGIIAEEDAFTGDPRDVEDKYSRPDTITWAARNAISGNKIRDKPGAGMTEGHVQLMQYAVSSIRDTTGINLELLGQQDQNQPGILEQYRKQAGMTILATLFDSLRRFRKQTGWCRLYYIQNYLADGRLIRVVGPEYSESLPLLKDKCLGEYDVVVDDTPTSPNQKEANWAIIQPMLSVFKDQLVSNPMVLTALLEYSPLPSRVVEILKQFAAKQASDPEQQKMKNLGVAQIVAGINKDQSIAEMNIAKAGSSEATAMYDVAMARHLLQKNDFGGLTQHLDNMQKAAMIQKTQADTTRAQAQTRSAHADEHATRLGSMIDAVSPGKDGQAAPIHHIARALPPPPPEPRRTRNPGSAHLPPGIRKAKDGRHYVQDPGRPGKWMLLVEHPTPQ